MHLLKLEEMTTEQKLGMTFCARPGNDEDYEWVFEMIKKRALGCVQVSPKRPERVKQIRELADYPIIIVCDVEGGFPGSDLPQAPQLALGACNRKEYYEAFAKGVVRDAQAIGFNACWSPVLDMIRCDMPCMVSRVISNKPDFVCMGAEVILDVFKRNGYLGCAKHYPGAEDMPYDNHMAPTYSSVTEQELRERDLIPYKHLIDKGLLPAIMTSHQIYANIEPDTPGTLSAKVQGIIRDMGFKGITYTDSFAMMAILQKYGEENVLGMAIAAGNDVVLPNYRTRDRVAFAQLTKNFEDGMFTEERLNEAASRVLEALNFLASEPAAPDTFTEKDRELLENLGRDCITAVCDDGVSPALDPEKKHLFVVLTDNDFEQDSNYMETRSARWYEPARVAKDIQASFPDASIVYLSEYPDWKENEAVLLAASEHDDVVFVTYCTTQAYSGTDGLTHRVENLIDCVNIAGKLAAVVHFGNPYALEPLRHASRILFGYHTPASQPHCFRVLKGELEPRGTMPLEIKLQ